MADKFHTQSSNLVRFVAGERPSADKFNAMNRYFSRSLSEIARAIGDIYDEGFPYLPSEQLQGKTTYLTNKWNVFDSGNESRPLDIVNLARVIGPLSNLNSRLLENSNKGLQEVIPANETEFYFSYDASSAQIPTVLDDGSNIPVVEGLDQLNQNNIFFDKDNRRLLLGKAYSNDLTVNYQGEDYHALKYGGPNYSYSRFNVIPDPNSSVELDITLVNNSYVIQMPTVDAQQSGLQNLNSSEVNSNDEYNAGIQIQLPRWMDDLNPNTPLPQGVLYLKNRTTNDIYLDANYIYVSSTELRVENVELCLNEGHVFAIICVGTDITTSIDDIRVKWFKHNHDGTFGEERISIRDLVGLFKYAAPSGLYAPAPSQANWNPLPTYLHRDGYQPGSDSLNGDNAMRGDLLLGQTNFNPGTNSIVDEVESSHKILFGSENYKIHKTSSSLMIENEAEGGNITYVSDSSTSVHTSIFEFYESKTQNNSIVRKKINPTTVTNHHGQDWSGVTGRTSKQDINEVLKIKKFDLVECSFNSTKSRADSGEPLSKEFLRTSGSIKQSVENILLNPLLDHEDNPVQTLQINDGLASFINPNSANMLLSSLTDHGSDSVNLTNVELANLLFDKSDNLVLKASFSGDDQNPNSVSNLNVLNITFISDKLRCLYKLQLWDGFYNSGQDSETIDHAVQDLSYTLISPPPSSPRLRAINYRFDRGLAWEVEVLGENSNLLSSQNSFNEFRNEFYIESILFPYDAYESNVTLEQESFFGNFSYTFMYDLLIERNIIDNVYLLIKESIPLTQVTVEKSYEGLGICKIEVVQDTNVFPNRQPAFKTIRVEEKIINRSMYIEVNIIETFEGSDNINAGLLLESHRNFFENKNSN